MVGWMCGRRTAGMLPAGPVCAAALAAALAVAPGAAQAFDYPTAARAEYVFACMAVNGQTPAVLRQCACSIDTIAERIPFDQYERIETVMTMQQIPGERSSMFRNAPWVRDLLDQYERAQAAANLRCF